MKHSTDKVGGFGTQGSVRRLDSVFLGRDCQLLPEMLRFYAPAGACVLDCTANKRRMWKGVQIDPSPVFMDIDPSVSPDVVGDFREMPFSNGSFDVIVFDPPHITHGGSTRSAERHNASIVRAFGLTNAGSAYNISGFFEPFLREARRVLRPDGLVFAKLKDNVHNHASQWILAHWINAVWACEGLTPCDLIVKRDPSAGMVDPKWQTAHHARNVHCWWAVVRKGRCERSRSSSARAAPPRTPLPLASGVSAASETEGENR